MNGDRILLVEDDKEIREGVEIFLKSQGYAVFQAADGVEGLRVLEEREIDLAIVDVMMPRMDGITTVSYTHLERLAAGKDRRGKITFSADNVAGELRMTISDDGKGIDEELSLIHI